MSSKFSGRTSGVVKADPGLRKLITKCNRKIKKQRTKDKLIRYINWFVRRAYGTEQARVAAEYGREFLANLEKE